MGHPMKSRIKGKFTFQTAGVLFILSALLELFSINSRVPLFGDIQGGMIAATYHLIYVALFISLGFGLYRARSWAYTLVFVATGLYTLDRLVYVLDRKALEIYLVALLGKYGVTIGISETGFILKVILLATILIVACWWGFAGYTYLRREYFHQPAADNDSAKTDVS
jgi:hypothetical protein